VSWRKYLLWVALVTAVAVAAMLLGACGDPSQRPAPVCATYQDDQGRCREEDDELVDDDPCDLDDAFEVDHLKTPKPVVKKTPAKSTQQQPVGGQKKRF